MRIRTSSGSRLRLGGKLFSGIPVGGPVAGIGSIMRIVGLVPESSSISYFNIFNELTVTPEFNIDSPPLYIVALSGSASSEDEAPFNFFNGVYTSAIINTLITGSTTGSSFTEELITTTGAGTWTKPVGVTQVIVECWGGGGAGGGAIDNPAVGAGGAGGQYARKLIIYPSAQQSISYNVGVGGTGGTGTGGTGGDTTWETNVVIAKGGTGGTANATLLNWPVLGGAGDVPGSVGDVIRFGQNGNIGAFIVPGDIPTSGFGGTAAGSAVQGDTYNRNNPEYGGIGGAELSNTAGNGNTGLVYGGGGSGGCATTNTNRNGGNGAQGLIRLIYR